MQRISMKEGKNYLELKVPVRQDAEWFANLRDEMESESVPVKWQRGYYHITVVFVNDNKHVPQLLSAFDHILEGRKAPSMTIDTLDAFKTRSGMEYVVNLTASHPSEELITLIDELRNDAKSIGANIDTDFFIHITLGRIDADATTLDCINSVINRISIPSYTLVLKEAEYRYYRGRSICTWNLR